MSLLLVWRHRSLCPRRGRGRSSRRIRCIYCPTRFSVQLRVASRALRTAMGYRRLGILPNGTGYVEGFEIFNVSAIRMDGAVAFTDRVHWVRNLSHRPRRSSPAPEPGFLRRDPGSRALTVVSWPLTSTPFPLPSMQRSPSMVPSVSLLDDAVRAARLSTSGSQVTNWSAIKAMYSQRGSRSTIDRCHHEASAWERPCPAPSSPLSPGLDPPGLP